MQEKGNVQARRVRRSSGSSKRALAGSEESIAVPSSALYHSPPPGSKNYVTPEGFKRIEEELQALRRVERPRIVEIVSWAAGNGDRSENGDYIYGKKRLREIDRRIRYLTKRHESAHVVDPALQKNHTQVFFGATVTYIDHHGAERTVTIVGIDEADTDKGLVSWVSQIGRAHV